MEEIIVIHKCSCFIEFIKRVRASIFFNNEILQRNYRKIQSSCGSHFLWNFTKES